MALELKRDEDGYYDVNLAAFNCFNHVGVFYTDERIDYYISEEPLIKRRLAEGRLIGEMDHPSWEDGMDKRKWMMRNIELRADREMLLLKGLRLVDTGAPVIGSVNGKNKLILKGWVKPSGVYGDVLEKKLDNADENVAFSGRHITKTVVVNGVKVRSMLKFVTVDYVNLGGMTDATKWNTVTTESETLGCLMGACDIDASEYMGTITECANCTGDVTHGEEVTMESMGVMQDAFKDVVKSVDNMISPTDRLLNW